MTDFVICINTGSNPASPILGEVYHRLSDPEAEAHGMLRIVDEDTSEADGYLGICILPHNLRQLNCQRRQSAP